MLQHLTVLVLKQHHGSGAVVVIGQIAVFLMRNRSLRDQVVVAERLLLHVTQVLLQRHLGDAAVITLKAAIYGLAESLIAELHIAVVVWLPRTH